MKAHAIVPQNALPAAKSRLGRILSADARAGLSLALLRGVCASLQAVADVESIVVMTPDPDVRAAAAAWGVRTLPDPCPGLNAALTLVLRATATRSRAVLVVAADLPFVRPADVAALLDAGAAGAVALAPSKEGTGTNAMLLPAGVTLRPAYGPGSLAAHRGLARSAGRDVVEVRRPGLAFDVDTEADLAVCGS